MGKQPAGRTLELTLLSAALRHLRDAEHLADSTTPHLSLDQAYHLAGFGPECARKAAIAASWVNKPLGHDLGDDAEAVLELALTLDPSASRYELRGWEQEYPALAAWKPDCRYKATDTYKRPHVEPLLREAELVVAEIMAALWADGRLSLEPAMITFDRVLPDLLRACETDPAFDPLHGVERACAVRDPHGRVRLVIAPSRAQAQADVDALKARLEAELKKRLEGFFVSPVLTTQDKESSGKIARALLEKAEVWRDAGYEDPIRGGTVKPSEGRWLLMERRVTKQGWLDAKEAKEPWPLDARRPVVTFYSFKGGVGRTTALVSCALQLAEQGKRVAVLDLDLEAPGLGPLLGIDTDRGVLDAIVDHIATERVDLDGLHTRCGAGGSADRAARQAARPYCGAVYS